MNRQKIRPVFRLLAFGLLFSLGVSAWAAEFPTKPVNLIIPYPPGGSADLTMRGLANAAKKHIGQPIICENKAGGGGTVGPSLVVTRPPDGYTLGLITASPTIASASQSSTAVVRLIHIVASTAIRVHRGKSRCCVGMARRTQLSAAR